MIAPDWLLYLGAAVLVLAALRLAGAFSRHGQAATLRVDSEKRRPRRGLARLFGQKKSRTGKATKASRRPAGQ